MDTVRDQLDAFHLRLNSPDVLTFGCFKRNTLEYPLVSYINHIVALIVADNLDPIPVFLKRAESERIQLLERGNNNYLKLVAAYLPLVVSHLRDRGVPDSEFKMYLKIASPTTGS